MLDASSHRITISVVSHGQATLVKELLTDMERVHVRDVRVLLTINIPEVVRFESHDYGFPLEIIKNAAPKGFGANHNAAFALHCGDYFCVLNPDIRLVADPFPHLVDAAEKLNAGVVAPLITRTDGSLEDSARRFPTPLRILKKALGRPLGLDYDVSANVVYPDWVAGMFMLFPTEVFQRLHGFDERYFLYYEDVDMCARLRALGRTVVLYTAVRAVHDARRESHRNMKYLRWHLRSMVRFFCSRHYWSSCCGAGSER